MALNNKSDYISLENSADDIGDYIRYYNIESDKYKNIKIPFASERLSSFLKIKNISKFNFILSVFSLYLSRIDRTKGCLLKTGISTNKKENGSFDINTLLKIKYSEDITFSDYLNELNHIYDFAIGQVKLIGVDSGDCIDSDIVGDNDAEIGKELSYYSINDFTNHEPMNIINGEGSALTLNVYEHHLDMVYNQGLFSDIYIEHLLANLESLIDTVIASPDVLCGDIDIRSDNERSLMSDFCHGNRVEYDKDKIFAFKFRENAKKNPDKIAIDDGVNRITFGQLERSSNSLAYDLEKNYGFEFGQSIGLMLPRNYHFVEFVLSLNKIGVAFIPIDNEFPNKRIEQILHLAHSEYLITTKEIAKGLNLNVKFIFIEDLEYGLEVEHEIKADGDDVFEIIFTSGTTGLPKGVLIPNKQVPATVAINKDLFTEKKDSDIVGAYVSFSFIASLRLYDTLYEGQTCRIFNEREKKDVLLLIKELKEKSMSNLLLPPSIGIPIFENEDLKLRYMILAGEKIKGVQNKNSPTKIVNFYGATESILSIASIYDFNTIEGNVSRGKPVSNTWVYILDENLMQMPIGVPGEICVSTENLSLGYVDNIDLTNEKFVDNPYCDCKDNKRLYRTGDIGFYNYDGEIEIIGREDNQLSVRGFRVESNEILRIMKSFDFFKEIVFDVENDSLVAYYTANEDCDINIVKDALKSELPQYMIPSIFIELDEIPLNVNGKIDKSALEKISLDNATEDFNDETLKIVLDSFKEIFQNNNILVDDDFVALGGNSLLAMKLQMSLKEKLNATIFSYEIFELATPAKICERIKFNSDVPFSIDTDPSFEDKCPLSESQLNVYLDIMSKEKTNSYNIPISMEIPKTYKIKELSKALNKMFEVHPILQMCVSNDYEIPYLVKGVKPPITIEFNPRKDFIREFLAKPFDLSKNLCRFLIINESDNYLFLAVFQHIIFDGFSKRVFEQDLISILNGESVDVDGSFLKISSFNQHLQETEEFLNAESFYDLMFEGNSGNANLISEEGGNGPNIYQADLNVDFNKFHKKYNVNENVLFTSAFAYTLSHFVNGENVLFNIIDYGRDRFNNYDSIGMFVNTLPLLVNCKSQSISSFFNYMFDLIYGVMKYNFYPYRLIAKKYDVNTNIIFQFRPDWIVDGNRLIEEENKEYFDIGEDFIKDSVVLISDFGVEIDQKGNDYILSVAYSEKFSRKMAERFIELFKLTLKGMIECNYLEEITYD